MAAQLTPALDGVTALQTVAAGSIRVLVFTAAGGAGGVAVPGVKMGDIVTGVTNLTTPGAVTASFETIVTVADQIQQDATNLTNQVCQAIVLARS